MSRIVISGAARRDRDRIEDDTIEKFGLEQAVQTREAFREALTPLTTFPQSARNRPELDPPGRRFRIPTVLGRFIVVYQPFEDGTVVRILDGMRGDLRGILEAES